LLCQTEGLIEGAQFADENAHRPAVGDDVMEGQEDDVIGGREAEDGSAQERARGEVEREERFASGAEADFGILFKRREVLEIEEGEVEMKERRDDLTGLAIEGGESGS
jgi:hypothetical protein